MYVHITISLIVINYVQVGLPTPMIATIATFNLRRLGFYPSLTHSPSSPQLGSFCGLVGQYELPRYSLGVSCQHHIRDI